MVKKIVLYDRFYNLSSEKEEKVVLSNYLKFIGQFTDGFKQTSVSVRKLREYDKRVELLVSGPEENFIYNILRKEVGILRDFDDVQPGLIIKGTMRDVGKVGFGIFFDCAISHPETDVLVNLYTLRDQLCDGKEKSLPTIISAYNFIDNFPMYIKITETNEEKREIQGVIDNQSLNIFKKLMDENIEALFISGASKGQVKKALIGTGHLRDIVNIKRFGFLEHIVIFRDNTSAPGIISHIGKKLNNCKLKAIRPTRIKRLLLE